MSESDIKVSVVGDSSDIDQTFAKVERGADKMAQSVTKSGEKAAKSTEGIGKGADGAARNVERNTKSMIASIQRQTAVLEAGSRTNSKYWETLASQRGVDGSALKPYLDQLEAVRAKQAVASASLGAGTVAFDRYGMSAKQTAAAMRGVPAQMTDIIVSLQGGQRPLSVLLQQGGQLKDMFGGIVPAARALASGVMGMINPFTLAAGAVVGLYAAYSAGASEGEAFRKTLILSGDSVGKTADQMQDMAARVGLVVGTQREAAAAINDFAKSTKVGSASFEGFATAAIKWEQATGTAVSETVKQFAELGKDPLAASVKLNESMNYLTTSTYEQIRALVAQGETTEAVTVAQNAFADAISERSPAIMENLNLWQKMWKLMKKDISEVTSMINGIGRDTTIGARINELEGSIAERESRLSTGFGFGMASERRALSTDKANLEGLRQTEQTMKNIARARELDAATREKAFEADKGWAKITEANLDKQARQEKETARIRMTGVAAGKSQIDIEKEITKYRAKNAEKPSGGVSAGATELATLRARIEAEKAFAAQLAATGGAVSQLNDGEKLALQYSEKLKLATDGKTKSRLEELKVEAESLGVLQRSNAAAQEFAKEREKSYKAQADGIAKIEQEALALEDQISVYGLGKAAIESMTIARLEEQKVVLAMYGDDANPAVDAINAEIEARERLMAATAQKEALDANKKAAEKAAQEWERTNDQIGQSLTDALLRGFESGKSFAENFRDTLKNMFRTLILQPIIQPIMTSVAGAVTGAFGMGMPGTAGAADAGGGNVMSSAMSLLNTGKSLYSAISSGFAGISASVANGVQSGMNFFAGTGGFVGQGPMQMSGFAQGAGALSGIAAGVGIGIMGGGLISGQYSAMGSDPNNAVYAGTAAGAAIGSIIPVIGTALGAAIGGLLGGLYNRTFGMGAKEYGDTSIVGSFSPFGFNGHNETPWSQKGGWFRSDDDGVSAGGLDAGFSAELGASFALMKSGVAALADSIGVSAASLATYSERIKVTLTDDAEENQRLLESALSTVGENMIRAIIPSIADYARQGETVTQTLERLSGSLAMANNSLGMVRKELLDVSLAGASAAVKLGDAFGGMDRLSEVTQAFYMVAYTEGERAAHSMEGMRVALQSVGVAMPDTMIELREMALALDLTTDAGRAAYATLLTIAPEFAAATEATKRLAQQMGATLLESFTAGGQLAAALDVTALKTVLLRDTLVSTYTVAGSISTLFLDLNSGLLTFGGAASTLEGDMTGAQEASGMLADQIAALQVGAAGATIDFAKFEAELGNFDTAAFVATIGLAFQSLGQRISTLIGDIANERIAVREAAQQIIDPGTMTPEAIRRQIASINTAMPGNSGVVAAGMRLSAADAAAEQAKRREEAARNSYLPAQAAYDTAGAQIPALQAQYDDLFGIIQGKEGEIATPRKYSEGRRYVRELQATMPGLYEQLNQIGAALNAAQSASSPGQANQVASLAGAYAQAVAESAQASAAATAAALDAKKSQTAYADSLQAFAIDAGKSVSKLSSLREETLKYYDAQKQLAELMGSTAVSLRKTVSDYRYGQMEPEQQFAKMQADFAKAYSMALSTDGNALVGYGDQLNSMLNPLLEMARDVMGSDSEYNSFVATMLARAESIAGRLDTMAPADYQDESLALLGQIDATLAALEASSLSAEQLVVSAINAARDATVDGLRQVANALTGKPVAAFAAGGYHTGGLRIVGENGPELESTGPARYFTASQTKSMLSGGTGNTARLEALMEGLTREMANLRIEARATAVTNAKMARSLEKFERGGLGVFAQDDEPMPIKEAV